MQFTQDPIAWEKKTVGKMTRLYCRHKHGTRGGLCADCEELLQYAYARLDACRFGAAKTTCEQCPVHCYKRTMRERVKDVMRYAGPRMLLYHPVDALCHMLKNRRGGN